jgi:hypothetical protein
MKTINLTAESPSVADLLRMARKEAVLVTTKDGESFLVTPADDFDTEVQLLRRNHAFLTLLDELKKDPDTIPLAEAEAKLR